MFTYYTNTTDPYQVDYTTRPTIQKQVYFKYSRLQSNWKISNTQMNTSYLAIDYLKDPPNTFRFISLKEQNISHISKRNRHQTQM